MSIPVETSHTIEFAMFGSNSPSGSTASAPPCSSPSAVARIRAHRWIDTCAMMEQKMYGESTDEGGRRGERRGSGREEDRKRKKSAVLRAVAVAWVSPILTPLRWSTEREKAETRQLSARILHICSVVTRVHRPCPMISTHAPTEAERAVKAAAMEASPNFMRGTSGSGASSRSAAVAGAPLRRRTPAAAPAASSLLSCASASARGGGATKVALTSATPTSERLRAPTSLVPSPHMSVCTPSRFSVSSARSFCRGAMRASTAKYGSAAPSTPASPSASNPPPSTHRA
mmetsp:Transcript_18646/g.58989  ORF Transcript_18646/g.58989 Transcript_18646/m.58989 type:complete len:287 (+) Transcript_18646:463-1323(+)